MALNICDIYIPLQMLYFYCSWRAEGAEMILKKIIFGMEIIVIISELLIIYVMRFS
ncbi:MAG: hypothetical protein J6P02_06835 [Lachnospiraceae bacterium]|nr:hypothetical protein [Lachnospiraceae bacterium]